MEVLALVKRGLLIRPNYSGLKSRKSSKS